MDQRSAFGRSPGFRKREFARQIGYLAELHFGVPVFEKPA